MKTRIHIWLLMCIYDKELYVRLGIRLKLRHDDEWMQI